MQSKEIMQILNHKSRIFSSGRKILLRKWKRRNGFALAKVDCMTETYGSGGSKYDGYVTSIAVSDEMEVERHRTSDHTCIQK